MWKFNKYIIQFSFLFLIPVLTYGQDCDISISGFVKDVSTGIPVSYATIFIKELQLGEITDSLGYFDLKPVCPGHYHISISHIGCETQEIYLTVDRDTTISVLLDHNSQLLHEVTIVSQVGKITTQENLSLNAESIAQNTDKSLATMLENISGVSTIKNGSGITKPVVHGLSGNRLSILNNGIAQNGQQWGVDHSPEIDPLVANRITVVKGVGALKYQGSSLGSIVLVEPKKIDKEPHLHGEARYFFKTNGLGNGLNLELQQHSKLLAWHVVGTLKKNGDKSTSNYYLRNTGNEEANIALQLEKSWNKNWLSELYLSSFNANLGVLRGSHIGNLTDLTDALQRDIPFYTEDKFSYAIGAPYQKVNHQLIKFHSKYKINDKQWLDFTYAWQHNLRKEFDVRRSGRSDIPALSLKQVSNFLEGKYQNYLRNNWNLQTGIQFNRIHNVNLPETGILPLIPDYISKEYGAYGLIAKKFEFTTIEFGGRYDFEERNVAAISNSVPRQIIRYENTNHNLSAMLGLKYQFNHDWKLLFNTGYAVRNPEVNELYSMGLHQGVSGIEEGDPTLQKEKSIKSTISIKGHLKERLTIEGLFYYQNINNYIFLNPQNEIRLTIRGAFPLFNYEQTNARLIGTDLAATYQISERFNLTGKFSYLHGYDSTNEIPLVNMPSNNLFTALDYQIPVFKTFENVEFQINSKLVFEQKNLLITQDFVAPPASYNLVGVKLSAEKQLSNLRLNIFLKAENLLNIAYRDYLNRQRYFADDLGFNFIIGTNVSF